MTAAGTIILAGTADAAIRVVTDAAGGITLGGTVVVGGQRNITVTATLGARRWAGSVTTRDRTATINRRWGGTL